MLRYSFAIGVLLLLACTAVSASVPVLVAQDLSIRLIPEQHSLEARAALSAGEGQVEWPVPFQLAPRAEIGEVTADGVPVTYSFDRGLLQVATESRPAILIISYRVQFDDPVPQDTVGIEDPSFGVTATIMPQGTFLSSAANWHPVPVGMDSLFHVTIDGPPGLTGVTAGRLVAHESDATRTRTIWQTRMPQSSLALSAGHYQLHRDDLGEIQLLAFMSAENAPLAPGYLASCREYLQLYESLFGPYPYAKFAVVENFYPTGYGLPGWTLLGSSVIRLPFIRFTSLPHEIAHAWWGNAIEVDYRSGNWCEGLATYVADYYLKELQDPQEALEYRRKILRDYAALVEVGDDLPLNAFHGRMSQRDQAIGYGKAAMVFHMLRVDIGDRAFWAGLQAAARQGLGKRYSWRDLQQHFEAASGKALDRFFEQWIERPGAPLLQLAEVGMQRIADGWQVSGSILQAEPFYDLDLPLSLATAAGEEQGTVTLAGGQGRFEFAGADRPLSLTVDPASNVFRKLYPEELPATVNNLRASRAQLVVIAAGAEALLEACRDLLSGLQWHAAPVMSEAQYLAQRPVDRDLLFIGWPESRELRPGLPGGYDVTGPQFTVEGKLYKDKDDVLFMVMDSHEENRVVGYLVPGSLAAAQDTARRIPHYGRYSTLVFQVGRNKVKSTWEALRSPLKVHFDKDTAP